MKESRIVRTILDGVDARRRAGCPIKAVKFHGSRYVEAGTPDLHITVAGRSVWIEVKVPGKTTTRLQRQRLAEWAAVGAVVGVAETVAQAQAIIDGVLKCESRTQ